MEYGQHNAYSRLTHCPTCDAELRWISTPIDDLKDCPANMDHTIALWAYVDLVDEGEADIVDGRFVAQKPPPQLHQIISHTEVVRQRETIDLIVNLTTPNKNLNPGSP